MTISSPRGDAHEGAGAPADGIGLEELDGPVAVLGAGTVGASWAAIFLARGADVVVWDPAPDARARVKRTVESAWPVLERLGVSPAADRRRLTFASDPTVAVHRAAFVQESGPEDLALKHELVSTLDHAAPATTVIASSTSGLMPSRIQEGAPLHPERILVGHPFNPPHLVPLVEVVPGRLTAPAAVDAALSFYAAAGKRPIRIDQELVGHVANRLQAAVAREAFALVARGAISVHDLDQAMTHGPGLRWALLGPILTLNAGGGSGGMRHLLDHLGGGLKLWSDDLLPFPADEDYIDKLLDGIDDSLGQADFDDVLRRRDEALIRVLAIRSEMELDDVHR